LSTAGEKLVIANQFSRDLIRNDGFLIGFLENPLEMEDFSLALLEDGQESGISHGFWGKLINNEGFSLWDQNFDRAAGFPARREQLQREIGHRNPKSQSWIAKRKVWFLGTSFWFGQSISSVV
jgi:hypothetical protein